jgi:hypothetical protein
LKVNREWESELLVIMFFFALVLFPVAIFVFSTKKSTIFLKK